MNDLILNITDACNLSCKYCFVNKKPHYISLETTLTAIDYAYSNNVKLIVFFGGEPLLCYNTIIVPAIKYIKQYNINISITTNGTLLTPDKVDFLKENNCNILFSFDGTKSTQDYNRSNSFDAVIKNIPYLLQQYPYVKCSSTVYQDTVSNLYKDYLFLNECGFKYWQCGFDTSSKKWTEENFIILEDQIQKIFTHPVEMIPTNLYALKNLESHSIPLKKLLMYPCERCGLGTISQSVNYDGKIYACHHIHTNDNIFYLGDIYNGIDDARHQNLLNLFTKSLEQPVESEYCANCGMSKICHFELDGISNCIVNNYLTRNSFNKNNCDICRIQNIIFKCLKI